MKFLILLLYKWLQLIDLLKLLSWTNQRFPKWTQKLIFQSGVQFWYQIFPFATCFLTVVPTNKHIAFYHFIKNVHSFIIVEFKNVNCSQLDYKTLWFLPYQQYYILPSKSFGIRKGIDYKVYIFESGKSLGTSVPKVCIHAIQID